MEVRHQKIRGCGKRKKGGVYVVAAPGDGILPLWTPIDPPIPYTGPVSRQYNRIWLDLLLRGEPYENYVAGSTADRVRLETIRAPEVQAYGMAAEARRRTGICRADGLEALQNLHRGNLHRVGRYLRYLARHRLGKVSGEISEAFRMVQADDHAGLLACMWRLWNGCPPKQRPHVKVYVGLVMSELGAQADALELK